MTVKLIDLYIKMTYFNGNARIKVQRLNARNDKQNEKTPEVREFGSRVNIELTISEEY